MDTGISSYDGGNWDNKNDGERQQQHHQHRQGEPPYYIVRANTNATAAMTTTTTANEEHLALVRFVHRLGSTINNNDAGIPDDKDLRKQAKLLMSLCCSTTATASTTSSSSSSAPNNAADVVIVRHRQHASGRSTPDSDAASSGYVSSSSLSTSRSSGRRAFNFTCPSLSLSTSDGADREEDGHNAATEFSVLKANRMQIETPAALLQRPLKVEDWGALRLSARAMARNIMQSFQRATEWRIQSWEAMLSNRLVEAERQMLQGGCVKDDVKALLETDEARLILHLRNLMKVVKVSVATTCFKVQRRIDLDDKTSPAPLRSQSAAAGSRGVNVRRYSALAESEYTYNVVHALVLDCNLNILTPAGNISIDLEIPGTIQGDFLSGESGYADLSGIDINLNTAILSSMIEKGCRTVVRASVEAMLKDEAAASANVPEATLAAPVGTSVATGSKKSQPTTEAVAAAAAMPIASAEEDHAVAQQDALPAAAATTTTTTMPLKQPAAVVPVRTPLPTRSTPPLRAMVSSGSAQSGPFVTPRDTSSPVYATDSDPEDRPVMLAMPSDFDNRTRKHPLRMISPHPKRRRGAAGTMPSATSTFVPNRLLLNLISPQATVARMPLVGNGGQSPDLPMLVEAACAAMQSKAR